jgi:hypothetical protein
MEALSQLDVANPDHVSVITREGKLTVSVVKDGVSVTLGFPINTTFNTTPRPPLQQSEPKVMAVKRQVFTGVRPVKKRSSPIGNPKLNDELVREIKLMLADTETMTRFGSRQQAYEEIARAYKVSHHTISNIHKGLAWRHVKV